jgi:hypothetical protein
MLLRNREERTGRRYFEVDAQRVHDSTEIVHVPDLTQLPLVETRADGAELLGALSQAIKDHNEEIRADPDAVPGALVTGGE